MPTITLRPEYNLLVIRDVYADQAGGSAVDGAHRNIAASSGYAINIICAQWDIPITLSIDTNDPPPDHTWTTIRDLPLHCETGEILAGDIMGTAVALQLDTPGDYVLDVHHAGRQAAADLARRLRLALQALDVDSRLQAFDEHAGLERYHIVVRQADSVR
jgi:hypothetical protein